MKIRMLVGLSGPDTSLQPGDLHDCAAAEAERLIEAGFAERIAPPSLRAAVVENAAAAKAGVERAVGRASKHKA